MTLGTLIWLYLQHSPLPRHTKKGNALRLLRMLEVVHGARRAELIPLSDVTADLVVRYQTITVERYCTGAPEDSASQREARERALRSTKSAIRQARSLFSRRGECDLASIYKVNGVSLPDCVRDFCSCHVRGKNTRRDYQAPPDELVERSFEAIELMKKDQNLFIAFWLASGALLRRSEIRACRWEFLVEVSGQPRLIGGIGKNGENIDVPVQARAYQALLPFRKESGFMVEERGDNWARRLSHWMRGQGWKTRLAAHELRAYTGSLIYRKDPVAAKMALRHGSIQVTERNYVRYGAKAQSVEVL